MLRRSFVAGFSALLILAAIPGCSDTTKSAAAPYTPDPAQKGKDAPVKTMPKEKQI